MEEKQATSMRLTQEAKYLIEQIAEKLGISQAAVMEIAVRRLAENENINYQQSLQN